MYVHTIDFLLKTSIKTAFTKKKPVYSIKTSSRFHYPGTDKKDIKNVFFRMFLPPERDFPYTNPPLAFLPLQPIRGSGRRLRMDLTCKEALQMHCVLQLRHQQQNISSFSVKIPPSLSNLHKGEVEEPLCSVTASTQQTRNEASPALPSVLYNWCFSSLFLILSCRSRSPATTSLRLNSSLPPGGVGWKSRESGWWETAASQENTGKEAETKRKTKSGWAGVPAPSRDPHNFPAIIPGSLGSLCSLTALLASSLQVVLHAHLQMHMYLVCFYILQVLLQIYSSYFLLSLTSNASSEGSALPHVLATDQCK